MVGNGPAATHAGGELDKELCTGFMDLIHKFLQFLKHLGVLPQPATPDGITQRRNSGDDQSHIVVSALKKELGCLLIKLAAGQLKPAEQRCATHRTQNNAVLDLHIADLPGGKQCIVFLIHDDFLLWFVD